MLIKFQSIIRKLGLEGRREETKQKDSTHNNGFVTSRKFHDKIDDDDHCKNLCYKASLDCLHATHEHVDRYMKRNIVGYQEQQRKLDYDYVIEERCITSNNDCVISCENSNISIRSTSTRSYCSYEDWIRECHPENAWQEDSTSMSMDEKIDEEEYEIDPRFYLLTSDHRIIWNTYVKAYGRPELEVGPLVNDKEQKVGKEYYHEGATTTPHDIQNKARVGKKEQKQWQRQ